MSVGRAGRQIIVWEGQEERRVECVKVLGGGELVVGGGRMGSKGKGRQVPYFYCMYVHTHTHTHTHKRRLLHSGADAGRVARGNSGCRDYHQRVAERPQLWSTVCSVT